MKKIVAISALVLVSYIMIGCGGGEEQPEPTEAPPETSQIPDYLEEGVVLAALIWQESFSAAQFYPCNLDKEKDDQYEVTTLAGSPDIEKGHKYTTSIISVQSHPIQKDEFNVGTVVLFTGDEIEKTEEELKYAHWNRGVIIGIDKLGTGIVEIGTCDNIAEVINNKEMIHIKNIRISDKPVFKGPEL